MATATVATGAARGRGARAGSSARPPSFSAGANLSRSVVTSTPLPAATAKVEAAKRLAAYAAVQRYVKPEHKLIGIGSGTTIPYCVEAIMKVSREDIRR